MNLRPHRTEGVVLEALPGARVGDSVSRFRDDSGPGYPTEQSPQGISTVFRTRFIESTDMSGAAITIYFQSTLLVPVHVSS